MKRLLAFIITGLLMSATLGLATEHEDQHQHKTCSYCGMDRVKFAQSRMLITYNDDSSIGLCSLHCAAVELANSIDKAPQKIQVADFSNQQLIDAESAIWVIGGTKAGVMTTRAKWAFNEKKAAEAFIQTNGGSIITYDEAVEAAYADMYKDTNKIRDKRKMKKMAPMEHK